MVKYPEELNFCNLRHQIIAGNNPEQKAIATTQRTPHNVTSYNKLYIAHLKRDND